MAVRAGVICPLGGKRGNSPRPPNEGIFGDHAAWPLGLMDKASDF